MVSGFPAGVSVLWRPAGAAGDAASRRARVLVPAGSVGIGGSQTGIYPLATPGGWQLLGRTPLALFDPKREEPVLLRSGDRVRFVPQKEGVC
ncbi:Allophanate hydrolase 2 subunit 1 [Klebsiella pneumoniae]|nr:Allophanate hydrolase 2 subunit 1 [Klebsiella pneumoniae]